MPPIMTVLWWLLSRGTGAAVYGAITGTPTPEYANRRLRRPAKLVLVSLYALIFGTLALGYLR